MLPEEAREATSSAPANEQMVGALS
jgi:hypothetical protein